ncbi:MAG: hypothetical protein WC340_06065 [Kiritimatiellia bacterium]
MKRRTKYILMPVISFMTLFVNAREVLYQCNFTPGKWDASEWQLVKSPRWDHLGSWEHHDDHISNKVPDDATNKDMLGKLAGETYTSMLLKKEFRGSLIITSTMSFDHRMAPLLVITPKYDKDAKGNPEHRDHFEIVLYDKGLNVWHHHYTEGKPHWEKTAFMLADFEPQKKHTVTVEIKPAKTGPMMIVSCNGKKFGYVDATIPEAFYVGITGCEGVNRFYDFQVSKSGK